MSARIFVTEAAPAGGSPNKQTKFETFPSNGHSTLSASLKPVICVANLYGIFPVHFDGGVIRRRTSKLALLPHVICGMAVLACVCYYAGYQLVAYLKKPKECLGMKFENLYFFMNEAAFVATVLAMLYVGVFKSGGLEEITKEFQQVEAQLDGIRSSRPENKRWSSNKAMLFSIAVILVNTAEIIMNVEFVISGTRIFGLSEFKPWIAAIDYCLLTPLWVLEFNYLVVIYVPYIHLFELISERLEETTRPHARVDLSLIVTEGERKLRTAHELLAESLEHTNSHAGVVCIAYVVEEATYLILVLRGFMITADPNPLSLIRIFCIMARCMSLGYVFVRLNNSALKPRRTTQKLLANRDHGDSFELKTWHRFLATEPIGVSFGGIRITANLLFGLANTCITYVVLLLQFQAPDGSLSTCTSRLSKDDARQ